jgi:hypothetical protein
VLFKFARMAGRAIYSVTYAMIYLFLAITSSEVSVINSLDEESIGTCQAEQFMQSMLVFNSLRL